LVLVSVRQGIAEVAKALVVLALLFLSFGHKPVEAHSIEGAALGIYTLADGTVPIFCGQAGPDGDQGDHSPCHACRIGGGIGPAPFPCTSEPAFGRMESVAYATRPDSAPGSADTPPSGARAPPIA
jgi:hypothetical protein